jgi:hypothetical protein
LFQKKKEGGKKRRSYSFLVVEKTSGKEKGRPLKGLSREKTPLKKK